MEGEVGCLKADQSLTQPVLKIMKIQELLASRTDLSTFLVHLTRSSCGLSAKDRLIKIIRDDKLIAGTAFGIAAKYLTDKGMNTDSQKVVCFTETPMEHLSLLASEIDGRSFKFEPYGIAVTRKQCRKRGVNPIWYLDITPSHDWLTNPINSLIRKAIEEDNFDASDISKISPFIEQMGVCDGDPSKGTSGYRKEFWWEREWRHVGDFCLPNTYMVLCPATDMKELKEIVNTLDENTRPKVNFLDPSWSLEHIIGKLAGFTADELGPF